VSAIVFESVLVPLRSKAPGSLCGSVPVVSLSPAASVLDEMGLYQNEEQRALTGDSSCECNESEEALRKHWEEKNEGRFLVLFVLTSVLLYDATIPVAMHVGL
jgi:hypothetical protein